MKTIKKVYQAFFTTLLISSCASGVLAQTISGHFFGENAWMPDTIGSAGGCAEPPCILNGKLHRQWGNIKESKASIIRFGGIAADKNMPTQYQYIKMIDSVRANGMEPVIQVPYNKGRYTAQQAADIVRYINITRGKKIKYWVIGNEPDLGYSYTSASQIAGYFKPFASAMKAVDPSILTIGPECAWFNQAIIAGLTTPNGPDDITGKDASGRYYLDVISFHTYPFNGSQSRDQVISKLTEPGSLKDNLIYLNTRVAACNSAHNRTGTSALKTAITEMNINWKNSSSDNVSGMGANSFLGGQFVTEMMGIGMKYGLDFVTIWSVVEGNGIENNIGIIDPSTGNKKPSYYHFKLMAENFKGTFAGGSSNKPNVKVFGSKDGQQVAVLILNQDVNNLAFTVRLNTGTIAGSNPLKINVDAGIDVEYNDAISGQSTMLLVFNLTGTLLKKWDYTLAVHAMSNQPPTYTNFTPTGIAGGPTVNGTFEMNVFPIPSGGKITIEFNHDNSREEEFEVQLFNTLGQEVYNNKLAFTKGREEIELPPGIADGTYILRVKEGKKENYITRKILIQKQ